MPGCACFPFKRRAVEGSLTVASQQNFQTKEASRKRNKFEVVLVGLDDSGKTSLLHSLQQAHKGGVESGTASTVDKFCAPPPTLSPQKKTVKLDGVTFCISDLPGRKAFRDVWHEKISKAHAILFAVDSTDLIRLPIVEEEVHKIRKRFANVPLLVLATKQDMKESLSCEQLATELRLADHPNLGKECTYVDQCSAMEPSSVTRALLQFAQSPSLMA